MRADRLARTRGLSGLLRRALGKSGALRDALAAEPLRHITALDTPPGVGLDSVVPWEAIGCRIARDLREFAPGQPMRLHAQLPGGPALASPFASALTEMERVEHWTCDDISLIQGFALSKANLHAFRTLDEMASTAAARYLGDRSRAALTEALSHSEIRIGQHPGAQTMGDHFARFGWDGRLFLVNQGGSHHLAAARQIAGGLGITVPLYGPLHQYTLSEPAVHRLCGQYRIFVLEMADAGRVRDALACDRLRFLISPFRGTIGPQTEWVFYLPKDDERFAGAADLLEAAGALDLGARLESSLARQKSLSV